MRLKPCEGDHHGQPRRVSGIAGSLSDSRVSSYCVSLLFSIEYAPGGRPKISQCAWKRTILGWASCQRVPPSKCGQIGVLIAGALRACETYYVSRARTAVDQPPLYEGANPRTNIETSNLQILRQPMRYVNFSETSQDPRFLWRDCIYEF